VPAPPRQDGVIGPLPSGPPILAGIVGSTAYGLAHAGSDIDRLGMYAAPTQAFHRIHGPAQTYRSVHPDATWHEAGKAVPLLLHANPTLTELLWLPDGLYETRTALGDELIGIRASLLSAAAVRSAYLGYAGQQLRRLENRGDGSFSSDTRRRTAKHARHIWRLLVQGTDLHTTGQLQLELSPRHAEACREFGEDVAGRPDLARVALANAETRFDRPGVLPDVPDFLAAEAWLLAVRAAHYRQVA
jgi:predicted nucleotidyltransferase